MEPKPEPAPALEPEPEPEAPPAEPLAGTYAALRDKMPAIERALVVDNARTEPFSAAELIEALGLTDTERDWETRLCRADDIQHVDSALSPAECGALRAAVDAAALSGKAVVGHGSAAPSYVDTEDGWQAEADGGGRQDFMQLALTRETLSDIIGEDAVGRLWALAATRSHRAAAAVAVAAAAAVSAEETAAVAAEEPHNIFARRYTPLRGVPWCPFHHDVSRCTVNVALSEDAAHGGGRLLVVYDGQVQRVERGEGCATVHPSSLLHAVSRMTRGVRYSLIIFSGQICPHSDHTMEILDGDRMRVLYPEAEGSYHCDGCGASAAALGFADMHHCSGGCHYALCAACSARLLDASLVHQEVT